MINKEKKVKAISIDPKIHEDFKRLQLVVSMDNERQITAAELIKILIDFYKSKTA